MNKGSYMGGRNNAQTESNILVEETEKLVGSYPFNNVLDDHLKKSNSGVNNSGNVIKKKKSNNNNNNNSAFHKSLAVVNVAAGLDGCDDQLLPASFRALEADLNLHPSLLGYITLAQTLMLSLFSPIWGFLSDKYSRKWMLVFGTALWGVATVLLAHINDFAQILFFRAINGLALGSIGPISQSILADAAKNESLGLSFGLVQLSSSIGRLIGGVVTTTVALKYFAGIRGWRLCFMLVGILSILLSIVVTLFVDDAPRQVRKKPKTEYLDEDNNTYGSTNTIGGTTEGRISAKHTQSYILYRNVIELLKDSLSKRSIIIILLEGFTGTIPWLALSFNTMFFQYCGLSDLQAAIITGFLLIGSALGGVIGGHFGDIMHDISNKHGRPFLGQLAMFGRVPLVVLTYLIIPKTKESFELFALSCFFLGLSSIAGVAVNRPIVSDIIRPDYRGTVFSLTIAVEGVGSSLIGAPLFGYLAEKVFKYENNNLLISEMPEEIRKNNAEALSKTLLYLTVVPWILSFVFYSLLHFTYGKEYAQMNEIIETEYKYDDEDEETIAEKLKM
ncbi:pantothenate transporter, putative [Plasmodium malariae]|uniref:Pantothenate transporter, putative n=1 Tax=Plasmodium malariae TaxID=5858 RepID=A0A1D3JJK3_PLAMA|nr:pantothenate transporter, putative [Plasmodium malariae]SBT86567.1 pantothenate transporter, putative [Plasmodium malariae]